MVSKKCAKLVYIPVGKHNAVPDNKFNKRELQMGIKVEMEHTNDKSIAKRIAKDHLSEEGLSRYYTYLEKMEREAKKGI